MSSKQDSRALRFYSDVLGLEHLHYGIWKHDEELTLSNLKVAQERYQRAIIDLLPPPPARILDVGCGTGELSKALQAIGYEVEGLSPMLIMSLAIARKSANLFIIACLRILSLSTLLMS